MQGGEYVGEEAVTGPGHAYRFRHADQDAIVAWAEGGRATLALAATAAWVVDRRGYAAPARDGEAYDVGAKDDGTLTLPLSIDPIVIWLDHAQGVGDD